MYCTIKQRKNRKGVVSYAVYLSERKRVNGKVKSSDTYVMSLHEEDIQTKGYIPKVEYLAISQEEKQMILDKLSSIDVPLHNTTDSKPLHTTTRIEFDISCVDDSRFISYKCYIGDVFIREIEDFFFTHCRISVVMKVLKDDIAEKGITDKALIDELTDKVFEIWYYYKDMKEKKEAEIQGNANYYAEIIQNLQIELAYARANNNCSASNNATTDKTNLRKAYKKLSAKLHPDNPNGSVEAMQMLNEFKEALGL